jgi:penicillin-binding protein 1A
VITSRRRAVYTLLFLGVAAVAGIIGGFFLALTHDLPQIKGLESFEPAAITRIYSADKELLAELFTERRVPVRLSDIPGPLKQAIVATEDRKFYQHAGVDLKGVLRAILTDIRAGEFVQGASTITQQLARTLFLTPQKSVIRKLKEAFLAFQIERRYTKNEILELYLNQVYFGSGAYGVEAAARTFFGKSVRELDLAECALIAGMPKSPSRFSPRVNESLALKRREIVLNQMVRNNLITEEEAKAAKASPLNLAEGPSTTTKAPYFVAYVRRFLEKEFGGARLYRTGLTVHTTLNYKMQQAAEKAVAAGLEQLTARMRKRGVSLDEKPQAALVTLDPRQGAILAMVGGRNFEESRFNRATMARRQPGSAFKPLVYACAMEHGFTQSDLVWDAPVVFKGVRKDVDWTPMNFSGTFKGEMTLRDALAVSENIPAVKLLNKLGPSTAVEWAHRMGIESPVEPNLSLVLGTSEVTPLELTAAYGVFPNAGIAARPFAISEVLDQEGRSLWRARPQLWTAVSPETAAIMTDMLQAVVESGTGRKAKSLGLPVAGKTGTTDTYRDALFVGFSPTIVTGVWVGMDHYSTLGRGETGARAALPIWIDFMQQALADRPHQEFQLPNGVTKVRIDADSGLLASEDCPEAVTMVFKKGTEPKRWCRHASGMNLEGL